MRILRNVSDEFWWEVARKCSYATFYQTPIWKELAERSFPDRYRNETFGAILPSGVHVVFPMMSTRRLGPVRWLESTFAGCYGGFIADGPVSSDEATAIYKHACASSTYSFYVLENPLGPQLPDAIKPQLNLVVSEDTYVITLDADFDTLFARFSRSRRAAYRRGIKKGVKVRLATTLDDYRAYYVSYRDAVARWGEDENYGYLWPLFEQIYQLSQNHPEQIKLWVMTVSDQVVGGRLFFYWNQQVSFWTGTAHRDFLHHNAIPVADTEILRDAIAQGYRHFDFNTSGLNQGMVEYKRRFGATGVNVNAWYFENALITSARSISKGVRTRLTSMLRPRASSGA
ncbi:GNAT family N-acetyltransferase [Oscillochloris sp. ZM17-4]|uniref:GNAT family N-acetyltransferase n=1 Tax=Oscillochloris sp. ZM17-4 TaxID=2866714 RepID=UPI001C736AD7|nr:GNAT family N-acetyltransferase [Oscillochloris sp. ZM17-4]MBX0328832.1 GNAT family N-acetyltransferase [Oscillochloris sp. ZM17-4]